MNRLKSLLVFFLLISNLLVGSINLYLNLAKERHVVNNEIEQQLSNSAKLLYFYDPNCNNCEQATAMINTYIEFGYNQFIDIEFVDVTEDYSSLQKKYELDKYPVENVPAIMLLDQGKIVDTVFGFDYIFELLDKIVTMAKSS